MAIKNLMEDIVSTFVKDILTKDSCDVPQLDEDDIISYVLNRVPAKYFTSERGILHGKLDSRFIFQQRTDIILLTHEAIEIIKTRRTSSDHSKYNNKEEKSIFLPHIIGEVLEETTFSILNKIEVHLIYKDKPASSIDLSWKNPYITNKATQGYYHFWPKFIDGVMKEEEEIPFTILVKNPKFIEKKINFSLKSIKNINLTNSHIIPIALLQMKEGVDPSFLYETD